MQMEHDFEADQAAQPFQPQAADLGGCGKPAVFGCLTVLVLLAVGFMVFMLKVRDMLDWALVKYEDAIVVALSDEVTADERERLVRAFDSARAAIRENRIDPSSMQRLQRFMASPPDASKSIGPETVRDLTEVLELISKPAVGLPDQEFDSAPAESSGATAVGVVPTYAAV